MYKMQFLLYSPFFVKEYMGFFSIPLNTISQNDLLSHPLSRKSSLHWHLPTPDFPINFFYLQSEVYIT